MYNLFLDDLRDVEAAYLFGEKEKLEDFSGIPRGNWDVVRNYEEFVRKIKKKGIPARVSFDNDLHPSHYEHFQKTCLTAQFDWKHIQPKMGLHALDYLITCCAANSVALPTIFIHTANCFAAAEMEKILGIYEKPVDKLSKGGILLP